MRKKLLHLGVSLLLLGILYNKVSQTQYSIQDIKKIHARNLKNSPFRESLSYSKKERLEKGLPPNKYLERQWELTMNPILGRPTPEKLIEIQKEIDQSNQNNRSVPGDEDNFWIERGPNNVAGRTKALLFDPNDASFETVFAGGVSGGLWKNTNISSVSSAWSLIDATENLSVSTITSDPNNPNIFYLGTGESYTAADSYGNGIWKSTDSGNTWTQVFGGISGTAEYQSDALLTVNSPASIAGDYIGIQASFGLELTSFNGDLVLVDDSTANPTEACSAITNTSELTGKIAVIDRGNCNFTDKVENAQDAGAIGVIMVNNVDGGPIVMGTADGYVDIVTISSIMISKADGDILKDEMLNGTVNVTVEAKESLGNGFVLVPGKTHINDIVVRDNGGNSEIYAAVADTYYAYASDATVIGSDGVGLYKSTDEGNTWTKIDLPLTSDGNPYTPNDLEIGSDGTIWVGTNTSLLTGTGGGTILSSSNGTDFTVKFEDATGQRVELAVSKTTANKVYAVIMERNLSGNTPVAPFVKIYKTTNGFTNTTEKTLPNDNYYGIPSNDFTNGQGWYDLGIEVDPVNDEVLYVGGINWFKSTNGGSTWAKITYSYMNSSPKLHPDQHNIVFADPNTFLIGNDGGVAFSNDGGSIIRHHNRYYNVTQFYHIGVAPTTSFSGDYFVAGAQDNGSQLFENAPAGSSNSVSAQGGDGAYCFFDQDGTDKYYITNYVYNQNINLYNYNTNASININYESANTANGDFICQQELDSNKNILFTNYSSGDNKIIRRYTINSITGSGSVTASNLTNALLDSSPIAFKVSPYTTSTTTLLVGLENGKVLKLTNADATPTWSLLTDQIVGSISDIEFGQTENDIFVTVFNYGVSSVWYSSDGGTTWIDKEGNLPDMPVNCILQNPLNLEQVLIGTDIGTWWTQSFSSASPTWYRGTNGMNSVKVTDLELRDDNMVFASTYGRGIFSGQFTAADGTVGFEDLDQATAIDIYPNPSEGNVHFTLPDTVQSKPSVSIYDVTGRLVFTKTFDAVENTYSMNLNTLKAGNYIVHIKTQEVSYQSKLIIQ